MLVIVFAFISTSVFAQVIDQKAKFDHAKLLYQRKAYIAARQEFDQVSESKYEIEKHFYIASCAVKADQSDGEYLINEFVAQYPYHHFTKTAYIDLGNYYFEAGDYQNAVKSYDKNPDAYSHELFFRAGYAYFKLDEIQKSKSYFARLDNTHSDYEKDAAYFLGFMAYQEGNLDESISYAELAFESETYRDDAVEFYLSTLYNDQKYKELINFIETTASDVKTRKVYNYLADAQYAMGDYRSAAKNYSYLFNNFGKARSEKNYFKAGYSTFKIKDYEKSVSYLKRSAVEDDTVGAYASYYLGVIYSNQKNYHFAATSFENTSKYDTDLKEEAIFQWAVALINIPNYQKVIELATRYTTAYPAGKYIDNIRDMQSIAYANTDNYDLAIQHIESINKLTPQMKNTYQRVSYLKGMNLYNDEKFAEAAQIFQKALIYNPNRDITLNTYYWMGEALSLQGEEDQAIFYYRSVTNDGSELYQKSLYSLAYAYFNIKDYDAAASSFESFLQIKGVDRRYLGDAHMRLGDCYFALKSYQKGINNYKLAQTNGNKKVDEIYFQIGLLNRYLDNETEAKKYFTKLVKEAPESSKVDQAYFQMAQMEFESGNDQKAIEQYKKLTTKFESSPLVPYALLNQAVAYDNLNNVEQTINYYKQILERFPVHKVSQSALLGLQDKNNNGQFDDFPKYLSIYRSANPDSDALENIEFETARGYYYNQSYDQAIAGFETFITNYSSSPLTTSARYFMGDAYYRQEKYEEALQYFTQIENKKDFSKYTKVLYRIAAISARMNNHKLSNRYYYRMKSVITSSRDELFMITGLMENQFALETYDSAIYYGNQLLSNNRTNDLTAASANLIIGKSKYYLGNGDDALTHLKPLIGDTPDERGAEAYLYVSKVYYEQQKYDIALENLFVLTNDFSAYEYWQGEAYLLMADIYIATDEIFQAKATLNSLIENITITELKQRAESKLMKIEEKVDENEK